MRWIHRWGLLRRGYGRPMHQQRRWKGSEDSFVLRSGSFLGRSSLGCRSGDRTEWWITRKDLRNATPINTDCLVDPNELDGRSCEPSRRGQSSIHNKCATRGNPCTCTTRAETSRESCLSRGTWKWIRRQGLHFLFKRGKNTKRTHVLEKGQGKQANQKLFDTHASQQTTYLDTWRKRSFGWYRCR